MKNKIYFVGSYEKGFGFYGTYIKEGEKLRKVRGDSELIKILTEDKINIWEFMNWQNDCRARIADSSMSGKTNLMNEFNQPYWENVPAEIIATM